MNVGRGPYVQSPQICSLALLHIYLPSRLYEHAGVRQALAMTLNHSIWRVHSKDDGLCDTTRVYVTTK